MGESAATSETAPLPSLLVRSTLGGALMGLANLVPGISGGTMLLACGIYPKFIDAIAEVTTLKFRFRSLVTLAAVVLAAVLAIGLLAGLVSSLVVNHRWVMYSLFIGLTLGGVPIVWRLLGRATTGAWVGAIAGFTGMVALAIAQGQQWVGGGGDEHILMLGIAGVAGASAMILPGVSGGYLLLVLGQYVPILTAIDDLKNALSQRDFAAAMDPMLGVCVPVGIGVIVGVVGVSNALRWLMARFAKPTLGVLLGLLIGAVAGLWPFQAGVEPKPGDQLKHQTVIMDDAGALRLQESGDEIEPADYPTAYYAPTMGQVAGAAGLILVGFAVTWGIDRLGREKPAASTPPGEDPGDGTG